MQSEAIHANAKKIALKDPAGARELLKGFEVSALAKERRFITNDTLYEKLGELLESNPRGLMIYRDELHGLLASLDKPGQEAARTFCLQSYEGNQSYTFERIGRGTVHIPRMCVAMLGGIQPGRLEEYVRDAVTGGSADDGLLQRFGLTVWPDIGSEFVYVDKCPDSAAQLTADALFERLAAMRKEEEEPAEIWRFDKAAQDLFVEWTVPFERGLLSDDLHPAVASHLSKYRKLVPALALIFALVDTPDSGNLICESELARAIAWSEYLQSHANRLYASGAATKVRDAERLLSKIRQRKLVDTQGVLLSEFTPRIVAQKGWTGLSNPDQVRAAASVLVAHDWLRRYTVSTTDELGRGRPSDRYVISPHLISALNTH